jgi:hypothetical protein
MRRADCPGHGGGRDRSNLVAFVKKHPIPIYGGTLYVAQTTAEHKRLHRRLFSETLDYPAETGALMSAKGRTLLVGILQRKSWPSHACHESVHCAQVVASRCAIDPLQEVEAFAYLVQWFFDRIQEARK